MKQLMFHDDQQFWFETLRNPGLAAWVRDDYRCFGYGLGSVREIMGCAGGTISMSLGTGEIDGWSRSR
jgi:hypothetical protein